MFVFVEGIICGVGLKGHQKDNHRVFLPFPFFFWGDLWGWFKRTPKGQPPRFPSFSFLFGGGEEFVGLV